MKAAAINKNGMSRGWMLKITTQCITAHIHAVEQSSDDEQSGCILTTPADHVVYPTPSIPRGALGFERRQQTSSFNSV